MSAIYELPNCKALHRLNIGNQRGSTMEKEGKQRGRPRKDQDAIKPWQFYRAARVMLYYDEARQRGEKHSAAIREVVELFKEEHPEVRVSETEVKRVLAEFRPRGRKLILCFERQILTEDSIRKLYWIRQQIAEAEHKKLEAPQAPHNFIVGQVSPALAIRISEKPNYPRHNRKDSFDNPTY